MKAILLAMTLFCFASANGAFLELQDADEFQDLIKNSTVPVVVQFSAYWCGPCQNLKATFKRVAPSYQDSQVRLAYVDAYENSSLGSYLQGGYPTVRTFLGGKLTEPAFVGSQSESYVRQFIDGLIDEEAVPEDGLESGRFCPTLIAGDAASF